MSLTDAGIVRLTELIPDSHLITTDSDFTIYHRLDRHIIPTRMP